MICGPKNKSYYVTYSGRDKQKEKHCNTKMRMHNIRRSALSPALFCTTALCTFLFTGSGSGAHVAQWCQ